MKLLFITIGLIVLLALINHKAIEKEWSHKASPTEWETALKGTTITGHITWYNDEADRVKVDPQGHVLNHFNIEMGDQWYTVGVRDDGVVVVKKIQGP